METKVCKDCSIDKPLSEFYPQKQKHKDKVYLRYQSYCKPCHYERTKVGAREAQLKKNYGIGQAEYEQMFEAQNGVCKICSKGDSRKLSIDHNHTTGEVRALLCQNCNVGIGKFQEKVELLEKAIAYLGFYGTK